MKRLGNRASSFGVVREGLSEESCLQGRSHDKILQREQHVQRPWCGKELGVPGITGRPSGWRSSARERGTAGGVRVGRARSWRATFAGRGKQLGYFFPKCDQFSLMDKETELQGTDVNLPKKEDPRRCSCCLSQTRFLPSPPHAFL